MFKPNSRYLIKTPVGFDKFAGVQKKIVDSMYTFVLDDETYIKCSGRHLLLTECGFLKAENIKKTNTLTNKKIVDIISEKGEFEVFDPVGVENHSSYFSNGLVSHNTEFLGSTNTLIMGEKLAVLSYNEQINVYSDTTIYEEPIKENYDDETGELKSKDHLYVITVDVSEGKNLDYSAFSVIDISTMPYKQVAIYRSNSIPPILFPTIIKAVAEYYNNAHVLVEINNNPQVADTLIEDLGYDNVFRVKSGNKKAQQISLEWGKNTASGVKMTPLVKRMGCSMLKTLVENDKLIISDFETISELTTFVQEGPSYRAEEGCNDDLAMTLVLFSWLATQRVFKEIIETNLRKQLQLEHFNYDEQDILPVIEVQNAMNVKHFVEDGAVWMETGSGDVYKSIFDEYFRDGSNLIDMDNQKYF
jgi:hypothetical protein